MLGEQACQAAVEQQLHGPTVGWLIVGEGGGARGVGGMDEVMKGG